ncbi:MAG: S8 family peptidase [Myxococcota bacterium]
MLKLSYIVPLLLISLAAKAQVGPPPADPVPPLIAKPVQVVPGSFLIKRKLGQAGASGAAVAAAIHTQAKTSTVKRYDYPTGLELIQVAAGASSAQAVAVYENHPTIDYIEPNYVLHALSTPNDPYYKYQFALNNLGQSGGYTDADMNGPEGWDRNSGNSEVVVGIIDTGIDYTHPDLRENVWTNSLEIPGNRIDDDHNGYIDDVHGYNAVKNNGDPMDDNVHGSHVAGIIGAVGNNGVGITGINQKVKMIGCKFLDANGSGDTAAALTCMNYFAALANRVNNPVKVVVTNNSWGGGLSSKAFTDAVKVHRNLGILFFAAAANASNNNDVNPTFPASVISSNVVTVAATDNKDGLASFSNYGKRSVLVAAPGVNILSTVPGGKYNYLSGTSMATPYVTGLAALLKSNDSSLDWISIKNLVIAGGEPIAAAKNTTMSGRRIRITDTDGQGSFTCNNQLVSGRLLPLSSSISMRVGQSLPISLMKINCAKSVQVAGVPSTGLTNDIGQAPDDIAYDGVFNGYFTPTAAGTYRLAFPNEDYVTVAVTR